MQAKYVSRTVLAKRKAPAKLKARSTEQPFVQKHSTKYNAESSRAVIDTERNKRHANNGDCPSLGEKTRKKKQ